MCRCGELNTCIMCRCGELNTCIMCRCGELNILGMAQFSSLDTSAIQARQDIPSFLILILLTFVEKNLLNFFCRDNENTEARRVILNK
jgi:hypothetical protein